MSKQAMIYYETVYYSFANQNDFFTNQTGLTPLAMVFCMISEDLE